MSKILITGGTGLIGKRLTEMLVERDHDVVILSRSPKKPNEYKWNISKNYIDVKAIENIDYIVHLAGAGIAEKRWTKKRKQLIIDSRVKSANLLFEKISEQNINLKGFISASGIGYYGNKNSDKELIETDIVGTDFLAIVCKKWEQAALQFLKIKTSVTIFRTGIVLTKKGGALEKMKTPIISPLGSGNQYISWIHIDDLCNLYIEAIENNLKGIYNAVSPEIITNKEFSETLAKNINRPFINIGIPSIILKLVFGKMSSLLLNGNKISAKKIEKNNYSFRFSKLPKALNNLK